MRLNRPVWLDAHLRPSLAPWLTFGNTSAANLKTIFEARLEAALRLLADGEPLVEIAGR